MTNLSQSLGRMLHWHWSPEPPYSYTSWDGQHGIGTYAAHHPGAFNIAWALTGGLSSAAYKKADSEEKLPLTRITWIPSAVVMGFGLYGPDGFWDMFDAARTQSLQEFTDGLTDEKALVLANALGFDFRQHLIDIIPKH